MLGIEPNTAHSEATTKVRCGATRTFFSLAEELMIPGRSSELAEKVIPISLCRAPMVLSKTDHAHPAFLPKLYR